MNAIKKWLIGCWHRLQIRGLWVAAFFYNLGATIGRRTKKTVDENRRRLVDRPLTKYRRPTRLERKTTGLINFSDYKKPRFKVLYAVILIILSIAVLTAIIPVIWLFITSFKTTSEINNNNYHLFPEIFDIGKLWAVWQKSNFGRYFINSLLVTLGAMASAVIFNGLLAYVTAIVKPRGYKVVNALVMISYMIPAITSIIPLFQNIVSVGLVNSYLPLMLVFGANAFYYINFKNYFRTIPNSLFEAAKLEGCSAFKTFIHVVVPLSKPIISVVAIFAMTASWSDFLLPYLVISDSDMWTVMVSIYNISTVLGDGLTYDEFLMMLVLSIIPQILIFMVFQKRIMNTGATTGMKE